MICLLLAFGPVFLSAAITFETLGTLPDTLLPDSEALGVNADGSVVVGVCSSITGNFDLIREAFIWRDNQMIGLGDLPGGDFESYAEDVSADGSVVVGWSDSSDWWHAFRWENGEMTDLGARWATGVSGDGQTVAGWYPYVDNGYYEAVIWQGGNQTPLGDLPGGAKNSQAWGISDDGKVVVGGGEGTGQEAFRWEDGVMTSLEDEPGGSRAFAANADGSVIVGERTGLAKDVAFRWVEGVLYTLNGPPGWFSIAARGVSGDGFTVAGVGIDYLTQRDTALMWWRESGFSPVVLNAFLDQNGVDRGGWYLETAMAVSTDGTTIVGRAVHTNGDVEAYRLRVSDPPTWNGYPYHSDGRSVDTGSYLGWLDVAGAPWLYSYSLQNWIFLPDENFTPSGAWIWIAR